MEALDQASSSHLDTLRRRIVELERENRMLAARAEQSDVAERAHRLSESRFRALFEQFPLSVQIFAPDGTTLAVNRAWHELFGLTLADVAAFNPLHDPQLEPVREYLLRGFAGEVVTIPPHPFDAAPFNGETGLERTKWIEVTVWPVRDDDGAICEVIVVHRDVTERIETEEALQRARDALEERVAERTAELAQAELRFRAIVEASPVPLLLSHVHDGTVVFANDLIGTLVDAPPGSLVGMKTPDFYFDPADRAPLLEQLRERGVVRNAELRIKRFDGTPRWVSLSIQPLVFDGEPTLLTALVDITERKETEEALRLQKTLLEAQGEASIDGILVISPAGNMVSFNRRFVEMWELPPEVVASHSDEAALQAVVDKLDDPDAFLARIAYLYEHPDEESRDEIRLRDGRVFDRYSAPVRSREGDHYGRIWFFRDMTERKHAEEALRASHERERKHAQRLEEELDLGRQIQLSFLPAELLRPSGWEVDTRFQPATQVAGDFYDTFGLPIGRVGLIVADVCGKGVGAALFMALFRSLLRAHAERASASRTATPHAAEAVLKEAVTATNRYIARTHKPSPLHKLGHTFASVFFGMLDPKTGTLHYVNAGHEPPVVIAPTGPRLRLRPTGPALGLTADASIEVETITLAPGETLLVYTDGVTEARNGDGGFFTEERLLDLLDEPAPSAADLLDRIKRAVHTYAAGADPSDDMTLMAIRRDVR